MIKVPCYFNTPLAEAPVLRRKQARRNQLDARPAIKAAGLLVGSDDTAMQSKLMQSLSNYFAAKKQMVASKSKRKSLVIKRCSDPSSRFGIVARILATVVQWSSMTYVAGQLLHPQVQRSELPQNGDIEKSGYAFLIGFGHSGLLSEGLDFSDYRTNASELDMAHLHMMLSSGGTGARLVLKLPSLCPSL